MVHTMNKSHTTAAAKLPANPPMNAARMRGQDFMGESYQGDGAGAMENSVGVSISMQCGENHSRSRRQLPLASSL